MLPEQTLSLSHTVGLDGLSCREQVTSASPCKHFSLIRKFHLEKIAPVFCRLFTDVPLDLTSFCESGDVRVKITKSRSDQRPGL